MGGTQKAKGRETSDPFHAQFTAETGLCAGRCVFERTAITQIALLETVLNKVCL